MRPLLLFPVIILLCLFNANKSLAQVSGIKSNKIYTLKSTTNSKLLDVQNASTGNNAQVDCTVATGSDAQKWIITYVDNNLYTLTNVASGKLLHCSPSQNATDNIGVDQFDNTHENNVQWIITEAGDKQYYLASATNPKRYLNILQTAGATGDEKKVVLTNVDKKGAQKWHFEQVSAQQTAPTLAIANKVFDAWYTKCTVEKGHGFWDKAEMMEILLDAYEVTGKSRYIKKFSKMYDDFITQHTTDWMYNNYNDDITWAVLFCVRGYLLTGKKAYLIKGREQFDKMYARALTHSYGGGLIWYETKTSKNACINGPAIVACCYLARATSDTSYYNKAIALYEWSKKYLLNPQTGKVNDNVDRGRDGRLKISTWSSTYNQGTYLGAATMLYKYTHQASYLNEAKNIALYIRDSMYQGKVMNNEEGGADLPGFKGILARYARMYFHVTGGQQLNNWMLLNAKTAYNNRNSAQLIGTKWGSRTKEKMQKSAFGYSTAVSLMFNCLPFKQ